MDSKEEKKLQVENPQDEPQSLDECVICCEELQDADALSQKNIRQGWTRYSLECGHDTFHKKCIRDWLKKKSDCPLCKKQIKKNKHM